MGETTEKDGPTQPATPESQVLDYSLPAQQRPWSPAFNTSAFWSWFSSIILVLVWAWLFLFPSLSHTGPPWFPFLLGIPAVVFGIYGLRRARREGTSGEGKAIFGITVGALSLLMLVRIAYYDIDRYKRYGTVGDPWKCLKCQANLRQIGTAIQLYLAVGKYPTLTDLVTQCDLSPETFICPGSGDTKAWGPTAEERLADFQTPGHCSYIYLGLGLDPKKVTPKTILAYENLEHHESGMNVLYADGTVEWVRLKRAKQILAELKAGRNPPNP